MAARNFVLVHGGCRGGWCYARVADKLRSKGHRAFAPTLTGLGERSHLAQCSVNLSTHIQDVLNVIHWERLADVVLCGHSYGGMVVGAVADRIPSRIASLVYLDAALPESGKSMLDLLRPDEQDSLWAQVLERGGVKMLPSPPAAYSNVNPADRGWMDEMCTPQPMDTLTERVPLTGAYMRIPKLTYVRATDWPGQHPQGSYLRAKADPRWRTFEVHCGHEVMVDAPDRLVEILLEVM